LRRAVSGGMSDDLRGLAQCVTGLVNGVRAWVSENPGLTRTLLITVSATLALTAAAGGLSLAIGLLTGPLAKLQLGFTLLTGGRGITGTIAALRTLGTASGPAMASVRGWGPVLSSLAGKMRGVSAIIPAMRAGLAGVFLAPGAALGALTKNLGMLALRLTGLPAIWSMITAAVSVLGTALSLLLSPIGLIVAAFVAAGVLIWRYWEPLKAFFAGVFTGIMERLAPLRETFAQFSPVFDAIGSAVGQVFDWFKSLLSPVESSRETLDKCASAGEVFGNVLG
ncbi:phage tail tape measure protein, partial [Kosakonia cowanii]